MTALSRQSFYRTAALFAAIKILVHIFILDRYGIHGDEFYFLDSTNHLAWGYTDHPPMIVFITKAVTAIFGTGLYGFRWIALLAGAFTVYLGLLFVRELGGGRRALFMTGVGIIIFPAYLRMSGLLCIPVFVQVIWCGASYLLLRLWQTDSDRYFYWIGLVIGIGLLTKHNNGMWVVCYVLGILLFRREWFRRPALWLSGAIAFLIVLPNLIWLWQNEWATLQFYRNVSQAEGMVGRIPRPLFLAGQLFLYFHPVNAFLWLSGLYVLGRGFKTPLDDGKQLSRFLFLFYALPFVIYFINKGKPYYLAPSVPLALAAGAVYWERRWSGKKSGFYTFSGLQVSLGIFFAIIVLPVLSLADMDRWVTNITGGLVPAKALTHDYHNQVGWDERHSFLVEAYDKVKGKAGDELVVLTGFYRLAGFVNYYRRYLNSPLPQAYSGHNGYWFWPPPELEQAITTEIPKWRLKELFHSVELVHDGTLQASEGTAGKKKMLPGFIKKRDRGIYYVSGPKLPADELWQELKWFHNSGYNKLKLLRQKDL